MAGPVQAHLHLQLQENSLIEATLITNTVSSIPPIFFYLQDVSDAQWRNFRSNLPILTFVFGLFILIANTLRAFYNLKAEGMSVVWLSISLAYLAYLHGALYVLY